MKLRTLLTSVIVFSILIFACSQDDDSNNTQEPDRDRTEQQAVDKALLLEYLQTHYYNSGDLTSMANVEIDDIQIDTLDSTLPQNSTLLIDAVEFRTTTFQETEYEFYILKINQGGGEESPNFTDKVRVLYEGSLVLDGEIFDSEKNPNDPSDFNLVGNPFSSSANDAGTIEGWQKVFPEFNTAESFSAGANVTFENYGLGVMFLPSGLAYFSSPPLGSNIITQYSNLIFKFGLLQTEVNDHDGDGIPSYIEDLNNNLDVFDDDTDEDLVFNYVDFDDDNDGVSTRNELFRTEYTVDTNMGDQEPILEDNEFELIRTEENGIVTITTGKLIDSDGNGIMDHLDEDVSINYSEDI